MESLSGGQLYQGNFSDTSPYWSVFSGGTLRACTRKQWSEREKEREREREREIVRKRER